MQRGECAQFDVTVMNTGQSAEELPGGVIPAEEIEFSLSTPRSGWTATSSPDSVELERGDTSTVRVELCAEDTAVRGETATVTLTATIQPTSPLDEEQTDTVTLRAELEEDGLFGIPWDFPPWVLWIVLGAVGVMLAAILMSRRRTGGGVVLECSESNKQVAPGRGTSFPVRLRNEGHGKDIVSLTTSPVPQGWDTFLPIVDVPLEAGDEQTVWISVKSPEDARDGDHIVVKVYARSSSAAGEQASLDLTVTVRSLHPVGQWGPGDEDDRGDAENRSVYEPEDAPAEKSRAVAVKRRKQ